MNKVILGVEDDDAAFLLLRIAFSEISGTYELHRAKDGLQSLAYLHRRSPYENAPRPDLILLNLNMPLVNGFEVLEILNRDPSVRDIPVVVFSSSALDSDRARCLALGARQYIQKPHDYEALITAIKAACAHA